MGIFRPALFSFLKELAENNRRDWFEANRSRYEDHLKEASFEFISQVGPLLEEVSPHFLAIPRIARGSLFRIHRDTRFSKDKTPYKTHVGIHFRHRSCGDVHAPGFYLHLEPGGCFAGAGVWHPGGAELRAIRQAIVDDPDAWLAARDDAGFHRRFALGGESLKTAPRGFDRDHPLLEDIRRKDFIGAASLTQREVQADGFPAAFVDLCRSAAPLVSFLCGAVGVEF